MAGTDIMADSVKELVRFRDALDASYGKGCAAEKVMRVGVGGSLAEIIAFCRES